MLKIPTTYEYIWLGGNGEIRSKTKVILHKHDEMDLSKLPDWNFDGSSTEQAPSDGNTEVVLRPRCEFRNPLRNSNNRHVLVLCDTFDTNNTPLPTNHRYNASLIFDQLQEHSCWFGLEQEYFIRFRNYQQIENDGIHYCGKTSNYVERQIAEEHLRCCYEAGLTISGINAEVATGQWEFQIGPEIGIHAADHLIIARYLLERIAEKHNASIDYSPKLFDTANGSGCHINFSTDKMRNDENGIDEIFLCMDRLKEKHVELIAVYGHDNNKRLTGKHETSSFDKFTWGLGTRNTSVRIPTETYKNKRGYFEDRRPAANIDPYLATSLLAKTCCL